MRALTLYQPWASLMALGLKRNETRPRRLNYRGPLAIHAAALQSHLHGLAEDPDIDDLGARFGLRPFRQLPFGKILCIVDMTGCVEITKEFTRFLSTEEEMVGDYSPGRFAYTTENLRILERPVPAKGKQGLWNVPDGLITSDGFEVRLGETIPRGIAFMAGADASNYNGF